MSSDAVLDKVTEAFAGQPMQLISSNLSADQETKLQDVFGDEGAA